MYLRLPAAVAELAVNAVDEHHAGVVPLFCNAAASAAALAFCCCCCQARRVSASRTATKHTHSARGSRENSSPLQVHLKTYKDRKVNSSFEVKVGCNIPLCSPASRVDSSCIACNAAASAATLVFSCCCCRGRRVQPIQLCSTHEVMYMT